MIELHQNPVKNGYIKSREILGTEYIDYIKNNAGLNSMKLFEQDHSEVDEYDPRKLNFLQKVSSLPSLSDLGRDKEEKKMKGVKFYLDNSTAPLPQKIKDNKTDEEKHMDLYLNKKDGKVKIIYTV